MRRWLRRGLRLLLALLLLRTIAGLASAGWMLSREPVLVSSQLLAGLLLMAGAALLLALGLWALRPRRANLQASDHRLADDR